jgi:hypothetical protein
VREQKKKEKRKEKKVEYHRSRFYVVASQQEKHGKGIVFPALK